MFKNIIMKIKKEQLLDFNNSGIHSHKDNYDFLANQLTNRGHNVETIVSTLEEFQVAILDKSGGNIINVDGGMANAFVR